MADLDDPDDVHGEVGLLHRKETVVVVVDDNSDDDVMIIDSGGVMDEGEYEWKDCAATRKTSLKEEAESHVVIQEFKALIEAADAKLDYSLQRLRGLALAASLDSECEGRSSVDEKEMLCDLNILNIMFEIAECPGILTPDSIRKINEILQLLSSANHRGERFLADNNDNMRSDRAVSKEEQVPSSIDGSDVFQTRTSIGLPGGLTKRKAAASYMPDFRDHTVKEQEFSNTNLFSTSPCLEAPLKQGNNLDIQKKGNTESSERMQDQKIITSNSLSGASDGVVLNEDEVLSATTGAEIFPSRKSSGQLSGLTKLMDAATDMSDFLDHTEKKQKHDTNLLSTRSCPEATLNQSKNLDSQKKRNKESRNRMHDQKIITSNGLNGASDGVVSKEDEVPSATTSIENFPSRTSSGQPSKLTKRKDTTPGMSVFKGHTENEQKHQFSNSNLHSTSLCLEALLNQGKNLDIQKKGNKESSERTQDQKIITSNSSSGASNRVVSKEDQVPSTSIAGAEIFPNRTSSGQPSGLTKRKDAAPNMSDFIDHIVKKQKHDTNLLPTSSCPEATLNQGKNLDSQNKRNKESIKRMHHQKIITSNVLSGASDGVVSKEDEVPSTTTSTENFPSRTSSGQPSKLTKRKDATPGMSVFKGHTEKEQKHQFSNTNLHSTSLCLEAPLNQGKNLDIHKKGNKEYSKRTQDQKIITSNSSSGASDRVVSKEDQVPSSSIAGAEIFPNRTSSSQPCGLTKRKAAAPDMSDFEDHREEKQKHEFSNTNLQKKKQKHEFSNISLLSSPCLEILLNQGKNLDIQKKGNKESNERMQDQKIIISNGSSGASDRVVSKDDQLPNATADAEIFPIRTSCGQPSGLTKQKTAPAMSDFKDHREKAQKHEFSNTNFLSNPCLEAPLNQDKNLDVQKKRNKESSERMRGQKIATSSRLSGASDRVVSKQSEDQVRIATAHTEIFPARSSCGQRKRVLSVRGLNGLTKYKVAAAGAPLNQETSVDIQNQGNKKSSEKKWLQKNISSSGLSGSVEQNSPKNVGLEQTKVTNSCHNFPNIIPQNCCMLIFESGKPRGNIQLDSSNGITCPAAEHIEQTTTGLTSHKVSHNSDGNSQRLDNIDKILRIKGSDDQSNASPCTNNRECSSSLATSWGDLGHSPDGLDDLHKITMEKEMMKRRMEQNKLFAVQKLSLVLDLDHTLLDSVMFVEVLPSHEKLMRKLEEKDRNKPQHNLFRLQHMKMWTKLRPGVWDFLKKASRLYELHIYTMGTKSYATEMAKLLDPTGDLFAGRVIARGDDASNVDFNERVFKNKDLDGVLGVESTVVIIDDTASVWPQHKKNLVNLERYMYFPRSRQKFGALGLSLFERNLDERISDGTLASLLVVIEKIHSEFFSHSKLHEADVRKILYSVKQNVLAGCKILLSGVIPVDEKNPHHHPLWQTAKRFGAICTNHFDDQVTHVVAKAPGIKEVNWALENNKIVVRPSWVEASALLYRRVDEHLKKLEFQESKNAIN